MRRLSAEYIVIDGTSRRRGEAQHEAAEHRLMQPLLMHREAVIDVVAAMPAAAQ
jgi:hypothetical protein